MPIPFEWCHTLQDKTALGAQFARQGQLVTKLRCVVTIRVRHREREFSGPDRIRK
jgi:hypothetical protein